MAQPNPGGPPPTFRSNVNRAKTKKWIEAKSYSYDGDDWGDVDDYDEYGGYDEPPPPLQPSRATGLRQRGQSASQPADQYSGPPVQQSPYGEVRPPHPQQTHSGRSFTQPLQPPNERRQNSFEPEGERRGFPGGPPQPTAQRSVTGPYPPTSPQHQPAPHQSQSTLPQLNRLGPNYQSPPPSSTSNRQNIDDEAGYLAQDANLRGPQKRFPSPQQLGQPDGDTRLQSAMSDNMPPDISNRRDFSPSAMPPPLQSKGSPSPNRGGSRPPRTSSLGQDNAPQLPFAAQAPPIVPSGEPANTQRPQRDRASSSQSTKGLPFVRPADIYRRIEEERERERQSQESSRPSMETIIPRTNPESNRDVTSGGRPRQLSNLNPVQERRESQSVPEGLSSNKESDAEQEAQIQQTEKIPTTSKRFEIKKSSNPQSQTGNPSLGPMLPDVARLSGFGDSFGESFMGSTGGLGDFSSPANPNITSSHGDGESGFSSQPISRTQAQEQSGVDLQHQPSLGFRSAVHQSFDNAQDQTPLTPSSNADSSIQRSASGGTNAISPIISRGSSSATEPWNITLPTIDDVTSSGHQQDVKPVTQRPLSVARKPSPSQTAIQPPLEASPPPSFIPGHRRNMSTPSPDNSPARTPGVEANRQLRSPQEVELAETTPTPTPTESDFSTDEKVKAASQPTDQYPTADQLALSEGRGRTASDQSRMLNEPVSGASPTTPTRGFTSERTDSPDSSKVRSLADKFGGHGSRPQSSRSNTTPRASMLGHTVPENDHLVGPRPANERLESFRPHLPGGWESSASIVPSADYSDQPASIHSQPGTSNILAGHQPNIRNSPGPPTNNKVDSPSTVSKMKDASQDAFAAAAVAGSALAASLAAATGVGQEEGMGQESEEEWEKISDGEAEQARVRGTSVNTIVQPEISMPALDPRVDKSESTAPTPLPKDTPTNIKYSAKSDYFSDASFSKPPVIGDQTDGGSRRNSHQLPPLSTNLQPQRPQYESDRLRREIVQELTPNATSEPSTAESNSPYPTSSKYSIDQSAGPKSTPESGGLPRNHGNYWNNENTGEDGTKAAISEPSDIQNPQAEQSHQNTDSPATFANPGGVTALSTPPRSTQPEQSSHDIVNTSQPSQKKPQVLAHRFSWEAPLQELGPQQEPEPTPVPAQANVQPPTHQPPTSDFLKSAVYPEGHLPEGRGPSSREMPKRFSDQSSTVAETSTLGLNNSLRSHEGDREPAAESRHIDNATAGSDSHGIEQARRDKELPSYPSDVPEVTPVSTEKQFIDPSSLQTASDGQSYSSPMLHEETPQSGRENATPVTPKAVDAPLPPAPVGAQPNIPNFRALLALKTPAERIRAYDNSREQFANHNSGLAHWLAVTTQDLTEHSDLLASHGRVTTSFQGHKSSPSRSGVSSGPSSNAPSYAPGFSPSGSGGKISSKEVQAKSKDFLHTAGVFGGKGIVAGKGLFSKGKSKFRGASGTEKASHVAVLPSSPDPVFRGMQTVEAPRDRKQSQITESDISVSPVQTTEPQRHPSESTQSGRNTPSEQSVSKGRLGDDERSSDDYESAQSGPDEAAPPPPRSSSLFIGDKNRSNSRAQPLPKSTTSSADTARTITHQTANAGSRKGTQSPRSTHSSNKTPTQGNFDHAKAMPGVPYALERTESPQESTSALTSSPMSKPSLGVQSSLPILPRSRYSEQNVNTRPPQDAESGQAQMLEREATSTDIASKGPMDPQGARPQKIPYEIRTAHLVLPNPEFSPLMGENFTGLPVSTEVPRDPHSRGLSIGSVPSALDLERPPSPVSPFVPPGEDPPDQRRGRPVVPVHHGIKHDFIEESSVERARRRSPSFSRPFQTGRTSEDSRPFTDPNSQDYSAFRPSSESSEAERISEHYPNPSSGREPLRPREQAPEYQGSGQGAPDMPPVETKPRSRRGSRSSAYLRAIRDSVSPSRKSQTREVSQPSLPDSSRASNSPHSAIRASNQFDVEEKPRRSSIFGRIKTNNSSRSDQAQGKDGSVPRAATMPAQSFQTNAGNERPMENNSPNSSKMNTASRLTQKLQRASTTINQPKLEQQGTKKNRFSSIGSLFGRNQKRQSSDQSTSGPLQLQQQQQYGQHIGQTIGTNQRFALDDDVDEVPPPGPGQQAPSRIDVQPSQIEPPRHTQPQPQRDLPAYVQDRMLRQPSTSSNLPRAQQPTFNRPQEILNTSPGHSQLPPHPRPVSNQSTPVGSRPPPAARSTGSWTRFSQNSRSNSNSRRSQNAAPPPQPLVSLSHIDDFVSSPPLGYESRPTQRSWIEGTTPPPRTFNPPPPNPRKENPRPAGSESPPPPPPPPKDSRWTKNASAKNNSSGHNRTGSTPLQSRPPPAIEQRQSLPPLQTNVRSPRVSARPSNSNGNSKQTQPRGGGPMAVLDKDRMTPEEKRKSRQEEIEKGHLSPTAVDKDSMTPEEKRKSRQEEIEKGHLTPTSGGGGGSATTSALQHQQQGKMSVLQEDESVQEKEIAAMAHHHHHQPGAGAGAGVRVKQEEEEPPIVMSATSFPGQMWQPDYLAWEGE